MVQSKRIQARIFIYLFPTDEWTFKQCPSKSIDDTITILYGYLGIMGYEVQRIPSFMGSPFLRPSQYWAGCLHCSGGWYAGQITVPSIPSPAPWVPPAPCCSIGRLQAQPLVLQPSQPSPAQPSPGQHRLLLFTQWSSATAQPRPTTAQPPPISWSRAARTVTPSRDQCHVSRVTTTPATCIIVIFVTRAVS